MMVICAVRRTPALDDRVTAKRLLHMADQHRVQHAQWRDSGLSAIWGTAWCISSCGVDRYEKFSTAAVPLLWPACCAGTCLSSRDIMSPGHGK